MNTEVVKVLESWKSSLDHYEKLDGWKLSANLSVLGAYLRTKDENVKVMRLVKLIRDKALCPTFDLLSMKELLNRFFDSLNLSHAEEELNPTHNSHYTVKEGQGSRFKVRHKGSSRKGFILKEKCSYGILILRQNQPTTLVLFVE